MLKNRIHIFLNGSKFKITMSVIFLLFFCINLNSQILPAQYGFYHASSNNQSSNALHFNGTPDYAKLPNGVYFDGDFTIECWVYPTAFSNWSRIIDFGNGAGNNNVLLAYTYGTSGKPALHVTGGQFKASTAIPLNQWTHVAATLNGTTAKIYINGAVSATANFTNPPANVTRTKNYIGRSNWSQSQDPDASAIFEELRIWSVARSASEIQSTMNNQLSGNETGLEVYYSFNQGVACGDNTSITAIEDMAASGGYTNATLYDFDMNNGCESNLTTGKFGYNYGNGLTSASASSSAYQIKQDYPSSTDGLYWIFNPNINGGTPFQIYADMTTDGGGWTLIMKNSSRLGWTYANAIAKNTSMPFSNTADVHDISTENYSIIGWADYIKRSESGFQYMIDATNRGTFGAIWTANGDYSFVNTNNLQTDITIDTKFGTWNYVNNGGINKRMPWYNNSEYGIITTDDGAGSWWGTLIQCCRDWEPTPWIDQTGINGGPDNREPGIMWYWVR